MEECENLCDRFTIIAEGEMKFVGSPEQLKKKYARFASLIVTLKGLGPNDTEGSRMDEMIELKDAIVKRFRPATCFLLREWKVKNVSHFTSKLRALSTFS